LSAYVRVLPDIDELMDKVLAHNPLIKQQMAELSALEAERVLIGASEKPEVNLRLSAATYEQDHRLRDRSRAIIQLKIPLIKGRLRDVETADLAAQLTAKEAEMSLLDYQVREQVLTWVQRLETLTQEIEQNVQNIESAERALDKARLLYEMEVNARIGRAQADMATLLWQDASIKFERALIWEQIDAMLGAPLVEFEK
jgi:outer membrane protein TolC